MLSNIQSLTLPRNSKARNFDFETYAVCKTFLRAKDRQISNTYLELLMNEPLPSEGIVRVLDVGTSAGYLLQTTLKELSSANAFGDKSYILHCLEPDDLAVEYLAKRSQGFETHVQQFTVFNENVEAFLANNAHKKIKYDIIFCTHLFYHIEQDVWPQVLRGLRSMLTPGGRLFITLVSQESEIYYLLKAIQHQSRLEHVERTFSQHGNLCFAEDLQKVLKDNNIYSSFSVLNAELLIPAQVRKACALDMEQQWSDKNILIQFLAFMFRLTPKNLLAIGGEDVIRWAETKLECGKIHSVDNVFVLERARIIK